MLFPEQTGNYITSTVCTGKPSILVIFLAVGVLPLLDLGAVITSSTSTAAATLLS